MLLVPSLLVLSAMGMPIATLPAQQAPDVSTSQQMLATAHFLFVVHDGVLHKFDIKTLALLKKVRLTGAKELAEIEATQTKANAKALAKAKADAVRLTLKPTTPPETSKVVERALIWLQTHQDKDGKWDADGFMKHDNDAGEICNGPGNPVHDVGVTGLAVMALLTAGDDYKKDVRRAVSWLHKQQRENGMFGVNASHDFIYDHAVATLAVCRACQAIDRKDALMLPMAQNAINYLESHRNPYAGWRYQPRGNDNDTSVTSWCLLSYAAGKDLGLTVNKNALMLGSTFFDQVTNANGHVGYSKRGEPSSRKIGMHSTKFPVDKGEAMTAASLFSRYELLETPASKPIMAKSAKLLMTKPPVWDEKAGSIDEYYWLFGTLAMQRAGGDLWVDWSKHLSSAVAPNQHKQGNLAGSWDPVGAWGEDGGRVFSTAALAIACHATLPPAN